MSTLVSNGYVNSVVEFNVLWYYLLICDLKTQNIFIGAYCDYF